MSVNTWGLLHEGLICLDSDVAAILNYTNAAISAIDWELVFVRKTFAVYPKLIVATNSVSSCALVRFKVNKETRQSTRCPGVHVSMIMLTTSLQIHL